jgi:2-polyprenyl-3-methyl-5-hydroxy-6-metoxy-1,4-benzoquinol methylase
MDRNMVNIDQHIIELESFINDNQYSWQSKKQELEDLTNEEHSSKYKYAASLIAEKYNNKNLRILDFGSGTGLYVTYLLICGYKEVRGVDIVEKFNNNIINKLGYGSEVFSLLKNQRLPYPEKIYI